MHTSAIVIIVIVIVAIIALASWPLSVHLAGRKPYQERRHEDKIRGPVVGGTHVGGGGRSVGPRRDEEVTPDEFPDGEGPAT
jgi:hypothetical protein